MTVSRSPAVAAERREKIRELAALGLSSRQIASRVGITFESLRNLCTEHGIQVPADLFIGRSLRLDANRIVSAIVNQAETLTADTSLIDFASIDKLSVAGWVASLTESRNQLGAFIRKLKEQAVVETDI